MKNNLRHNDIPKYLKEYMHSDHLCPWCKSENIEGGSVERDSCGATQPVHCPDCGKDWYDDLALTGISIPTTNPDGSHDLVYLSGGVIFREDANEQSRDENVDQKCPYNNKLSASHEPLSAQK